MENLIRQCQNYLKLTFKNCRNVLKRIITWVLFDAVVGNRQHGHGRFAGRRTSRDGIHKFERPEKKN